MRRGIALALVYLIMLAGTAQGTLAAANAGHAQLICTASGASVVQHAPDSGTPDHEAQRWHCATLCQVSSAGAPAVLGAQTGSIPAPQADAPAGIRMAAEILPPSFHRLTAEARAPPSSL